MSARQRWGAIAQGIQQDLQAYQALRQLLKQQFHAALRHDAVLMAQLGEAIETQAAQLEQARQLRVQHAKALLPPQAALSMTALFAQLQQPLQGQLQGLWQQLEALVVDCKQLNMRNCQLIMEQAEIMREVIASRAGTAVATDIYAPL